MKGQRLRVLVLGGRGFIGRHVTSALESAGADVIVGTRMKASGRRSWRQVRMEQLQDPEDWMSVLEGCDVVVNCVGILRPRGRETYEHVHHHGPAALATACRDLGLRLVHVSALGLDAPVRSGFLRSKRHGEQAIRAAGGDWLIVRPSLLEGADGFGARWIRRVARWPWHPVPAGATGRIAVLDVRDLGVAVANLALKANAQASTQDVREHDLGGMHAHTLAEHFAALRALHDSRRAVVVTLPDLLTRALAHICDLLHWTPLSYGHWELLRSDNCPHINSLPELLGHAPRTVGVLSCPPCAADGLLECHRNR